MKEYVMISFTEDLSQIRAKVFLKTHKKDAMRMKDEAGEPIRVMMDNGDIYYFIPEKDKKKFMKAKKYKVIVTS